MIFAEEEVRRRHFFLADFEKQVMALTVLAPGIYIYLPNTDITAVTFEGRKFLELHSSQCSSGLLYCAGFCPLPHFSTMTITRKPQKALKTTSYYKLQFAKENKTQRLNSASHFPLATSAD